MSWNKTHSKALEEKVARLKEANQELREQLKAKDNEIERLNEALEVMTAMCEVGLKTQDTYRMIVQKKMKSQNKARSIVAMLFWNYRRIPDFNMRNAAYFCFREAYSKLKS